MGMDLKEKDYTSDHYEQWKGLLLEARLLGMSPKEIRSFLEMARTIDLAKWRQNEQDNRRC